MRAHFRSRPIGETPIVLHARLQSIFCFLVKTFDTPTLASGSHVLARMRIRVERRRARSTSSTETPSPRSDASGRLRQQRTTILDVPIKPQRIGQSAAQRFVVSVGQPMTVQNGRAKPQTPNSYLASFRERPGSAVARPVRGPDPQRSGSLYPPENCGGSTALEETSEPAILMVHQEEADALANPAIPGKVVSARRCGQFGNVRIARPSASSPMQWRCFFD